MASTAVLHPQLTPQELQNRRDHVDSAMGTTLAEGVAPAEDVVVLLEAYARGEVDLSAVMRRVQAVHGK